MAVYDSVHTGTGSGFDLVCLVGSLGGLEAYQAVLRRLPADLPAAVVVVQHRPLRETDQLPPLLQRWSALPVEPLRDGDTIEPGRVQVVPGATTAVLSVTASGQVCAGLAPAPATRCADPLFMSAARAYRARLLAVVLSGRLSDGVEGVRHVKGGGGRVLVQDVATCPAPDMPRGAMSTGCVDFALPPSVLGDAITALVLAPGARHLMQVPAPPWATPVRRVEAFAHG